ncbi:MULTISPECIES: hypothetical protein [unclassified Streptomyces]|uniref:hypothetical protein n=1 Tax=unclassified Streptomyces TaxID=2593676 RepID=UPI00331CB5C6
MGDLVPLLIAVAALASVMGFFGWLAVVARRRGVAGTALSAALASYDEAYRGTAHQAYHEIRAQAERRTPLLSPDGTWRPAPPGGDSGEGIRRRRSAARRPPRGLRGLRRRFGRLRLPR